MKKTLSIPEWLNEEALRLGLNFSQELQEALMQKIGIVRKRILSLCPVGKIHSVLRLY